MQGTYLEGYDGQAGGCTDAALDISPVGVPVTDGTGIRISHRSAVVTIARLRSGYGGSRIDRQRRPG